MKAMDRQDVTSPNKDAALARQVLEKLIADRNPEAVWDAFRSGWIEERTALLLLSAMRKPTLFSGAQLPHSAALE